MIEIYRPGTNPRIKDFGYTPVDIWSIPIIPRSEWGALPPKEDIETMPLPVTNIGSWGVEENDDPDFPVCREEDECKRRVLELQKKHMDEGYPDIKYNFIIGDDGNIYEGRGWDKRPAVYWDDNPDFKGLNKHMIEVGYIGIQDMKFLHYTMFESFQALIGQGVEKKYVTEDYKMWDLFSVNPYEGMEEDFMEDMEDNNEEENKGDEK